MRHILFDSICVIVGASIGVVAAGCCEKHDVIFDDPQYKWLKPIGEDLDPVAKGLDEYGTISMSTPLLTEPDSSFAFDLKNPSSQYYSQARSDINGESASSSQQSSVNSSGTQIQLDVQQLVQEGLAAATGGASALLAAAGKPTTLPAINVNVLPTTQPASSPLTDKFTAAMGLLKGPGPVLENRAAIITAAGDSATQAMLNFLVGTELASKFKDKKVLLGVSMIAVRPGTLTATGFNASVAQSFTYTYVPVRKDLDRKIRADVNLRGMIEAGALASLPREGDRFPLVAAVSPMTEAQILDLQNSARNQRERATKIAAALAGFGAGVQSQAFTDWLNRTESDTATVSSMNVVSAFAHAPNICGFSVTPRLRALADPANQSSQNKSAMVLDPVSFPALVLVGVDMDDLRVLAVPRASRAPDTKPGNAGPNDTRPSDTGPSEMPPATVKDEKTITTAPATAPADSQKTPLETKGQEFDFFEPVLTMYQSTHWTPLPAEDQSTRQGAALSETQRLAWAAHVERATNRLAEHNKSPNVWNQRPGHPNTTEPVVEFLNQEINALGSQSVYSSTWQYIPEAILADASGGEKRFSTPQIEEMIAADTQTNANGIPTTQPVWIIGTDLESIDLTTAIVPVLPAGGDSASLPTITFTNPKLIGSGAKTGAWQAINFDAHATGGKGHVPVAFEFTYKDDNGKLLHLITPPIDVHAPDPQPSKSQTIIRAKEEKGARRTETLTFPSDVPLGTIQSFLNGPATQPAIGAAEVDVNVHAKERAK